MDSMLEVAELWDRCVEVRQVAVCSQKSGIKENTQLAFCVSVITKWVEMSLKGGVPRGTSWKWECWELPAREIEGLNIFICDLIFLKMKVDAFCRQDGERKVEVN
jgi:hypothetical protein